MAFALKSERLPACLPMHTVRAIRCNSETLATCRHSACRRRVVGLLHERGVGGSKHSEAAIISHLARDPLARPFALSQRPASAAFPQKYISIRHYHIIASGVRPSVRPEERPLGDICVCATT